MVYKSIHGRQFGYDNQTGLISFKGRPVSVVDSLRYDGRVFFASSVDGAASSDGTNPSGATATMAQALAKCTADRGDVILLGPGHDEVIGDEQIEIGIAGVTIIGLGRGSKQARFHHNHANAEIEILAAGDNVTIQNVRFSADVTGVLIGIDIEAGADDFILRDCLFDTVTGGTDEYVIGVQNNAGCDNTIIENNVFDMGIAGTAVTVKITGASDRVTVRGNTFYGDASTAHINGITTLSTRVMIQDNLIANGIGGDMNSEPGIELLTGTTGFIERNRVYCNLATKLAAIVADTCLMHENYYSEDIAQTTGIIGVASADD